MSPMPQNVRFLPRLLPAALLLTVAGCVGTPSTETSYNPMSSRKYDGAWILVTPKTMAKPDFPIKTVFDNTSRETPVREERPSAANGNTCIVHGPKPGGEWQLTAAQWQGAWVKAKTVCTFDAAQGRFLPDGNEPSERGLMPWALDAGDWQHVAGQLPRWQAYYLAWGGPSAKEIPASVVASADPNLRVPAGVIGEYHEPTDHARGPFDTAE
jgi:hypothetical protein